MISERERRKLQDEFYKGKGRAYLYVLEKGADEVEDEILYFCLKNAMYDPQLEEERSDWLFSIIDLTGKNNFYYSKIIDALIIADEYHDLEQLSELARLIYERGIKKARTALYEKFDRQEFNESYLCGREIVCIDKFDGLLHVAKTIGKKLLSDSEYWDSGSVFYGAGELLGQVEVTQFLEDHSHQDENVKAYLNEIKSRETESILAKRKTLRERVRERYPIERILSEIEQGKGKYPGYYGHFGIHATEEEIDRVYKKFLIEERQQQLVRYLWIFRKRNIPQLNNKLFSLAESECQELQLAAFVVLSHFKDSAIRDLAIKYCKSEDNEIPIGILKLFINNYNSGDYQLIETVLSTIEDDNTLHWACRDVINIFEKNPLKELSQCLAWIYNNTPCSYCRNLTVKQLIDKKLISEELLYECQFDCVEDTRKMAKQCLQK